MGKNTTPQVQQIPLINQGQQGLLGNLTGLLQQQLGQGGPVFGGQFAAGTSPLQQQGFGGFGAVPGAASSLFGQIPQAQAQGQGFLQQGGQALNQILQPFDPTAAQDFFQQSIGDPATRRFQEQILPSVAERFISRGQGRSGGLQTALGRAASDFGGNLAGQLASTVFGAQQAHLGRQQQGVNQALSFSQAPLGILGAAGQVGGQGANLLQSLLGAGGQQRGIEQQGLSGEFQRFQQGLPSNNPFLQFLPQALGARSFENVLSQRPNPLGSLLGGLGGALQGPLGEALAGGLGGLFGGQGQLAQSGTAQGQQQQDGGFDFSGLLSGVGQGAGLGAPFGPFGSLFGGIGGGLASIFG